MAVTIFPTSPNGAITEANWTGADKAANGNMSYRVSGWDLSVNAGLNLDVAAGTAVIDGFYVNESGTTTVALTDNATNRVWLQADGTIYDNTSDTPTAATDLFLGRVTTSGGSITAIVPSQELVSGVGVEYNSRKKAWAITENIGTATFLTTLADLALEPGLYWVRCIIFADGQALAGGQSFGVQVDVATAAESTIELGVLGHGDEGSADQSAWTNGGSTINFTATANTIDVPVHIVGMVELADSGTLQIKATTSSFFIIRPGGFVQTTKIV